MAWNKWIPQFTLASPRSAALPADYLDSRAFPLTVLAAVLLHLAGLYAWHMMPHMKVVDIPVRALNIKLGEEDSLTPEELKQAQFQLESKSDDAVSRVFRDTEAENQARRQTVMNSMEKAMGVTQEKPQKPQKPEKAEKVTPPKIVRIPPPPAPRVPLKEKPGVKGKFDVRPEGVAAAAPVVPVEAKQFVRETKETQVAENTAATQVKPATALSGNSTAKNAEMVSRYEQLISLWIEKFKIYPSEARARGMEGETVVRIRIDRQGNIRYYILEHSTGSEILDRAATDMIRRANPVPAVPQDYPPGDLMEFLIPVNFHLQ